MKLMRIGWCATISFLLATSLQPAGASGRPAPYHVIDNADAAIAIAKIYLSSEYNKKEISAAEPFSAKKLRHKWVVTGFVSPNAVGRSFMVELDSIRGGLIEMHKDM